MNNLKEVLATFILTSSIFIGTTIGHTNEISKLEASQGLRDSEIARLEDVIKSRENDIKEVDSKLNENLQIVESQKKEIEQLKIDNSKLKADNQKLEEQINFKKQEKGSDVQGGRKLNATFTAYTANCNGCSGVTATGIDVRNSTTYNGYRILATDPSVIPLYSIVQVDVNGQSFQAIALDKGGAIKGGKIDYLVGSYGEAIKFGRQQGTITILREGK